MEPGAGPFEEGAKRVNLSQEIIPAEVVTALHEAAHAVAHAGVGWACASASIVAVGNRLGEVRTDRAQKYPGELAEAIVLVAGYVAEDLPALRRVESPAGRASGVRHRPQAPLPPGIPAASHQ